MGLVDRLRGGLARTREVLNTPIEDLVRGRRPLDAAALECRGGGPPRRGPGPSRGGRGHGGAARAGAARSPRAASPRCARSLGEEMRRALERPAGAAPFSARPWVVFVVGVNGAGKTTTIGKLAAGWTAEGRSVLLCAADTFRAAAAEQLEVWADARGSRLPPGRRGRRPVRGADRRAALGPRPRDGRRARRHRGPAPHEGEPHGRAREDGARGRPRGAGGAARDPAGARRHRGQQRPRAGPRVREGRRA